MPTRCDMVALQLPELFLLGVNFQNTLLLNLFIIAHFQNYNLSTKTLKTKLKFVLTEKLKTFQK